MSFLTDIGVCFLYFTIKRSNISNACLISFMCPKEYAISFIDFTEYFLLNFQ